MGSAKRSEADGLDTLLRTCSAASESLKKACSLWVNTVQPPQMEPLKNRLLESLVAAYGSVQEACCLLRSAKDFIPEPPKAIPVIKGFSKDGTPS